MGLPLYFVEDLAGLAPASVGLASVLPRCSVRQTFRGPSGGAGVLANLDGSRLEYSADKQTWRKLPGGKVWFGYWNEDRPAPADLKRDEQLPGHTVKLRDGNDWSIPLARKWSDAGAIPQIPAALDFDESGNLIRGQVEDRYRLIEQAATEFADFFFARKDLDVMRTVDLAADALGTNYRLGRYEILALGLFDDQWIACQDVLRALIDWPGMQEILQTKKPEGQQSAEPSTSLGDAA